MQDTAGCLGAVMVKVLACDAFAIGALRVRESIMSSGDAMSRILLACCYGGEGCVVDPRMASLIIDRKATNLALGDDEKLCYGKPPSDAVCSLWRGSVCFIRGPVESPSGLWSVDTSLLIRRCTGAQDVGG